ncbi:MAG: ATP-binding protein [Xanthobacteraceae bacterium]|jgi:signal transduction histidine kinase/CheY-like chemotaxis protein
MISESPLRILLLEDSAADAELVRELLEADGLICDVVRVQTRAEFVSALEDRRFDLILADYSLPSFDGISALRLALAARPDLPFIFVSGTLGEEVAIDALKIGATDYVLKTRLSRLVPAVQRAMREAEERAKRKKAEQALRRSEAYLSEAQRLSRTGSFGWDVTSGQIYWSDETFRIFECDPSTTPTVATILDRAHPEDRPRVRRTIERAATEKRDFADQYRLMMPDGSVKHVRVLAHRTPAEEADSVVFVGAVTDITERKHAEEESARLRQLEADLTRINRVSMMAELAASLAHEIKQPIAGAAVNAATCLRWLHDEPPRIEDAGRRVSAIVNDLKRATDIIDRNHSIYRRGSSRRELIDPNEVIRHMIALLRDAADRNSIAIRTELAPQAAMTAADRVQLQQVLMNLMLNGIEAMKGGSGALTITSKHTEDGQLMVSVGDSGVGLPVEGEERIFEAFFTTKPDGTGIGLPLSRRIIESHGGRLWASASTPRGAVFHFTLPITRGRAELPRANKIGREVHDDE